MNPIVLGALIGAIPALLGGALATWAAMRSSRISMDQTELTLRADHERWLREKRCDLYVEMIKLLREDSSTRRALIREGEVTDEQRRKILEAAGHYRGGDLTELTVRGTAIASDQVSIAFIKAAEAGQLVWQAVIDVIRDRSEHVGLAGELGRLAGLAAEAESGFAGTVRRDLAVTGESTLPGSPVT
jgi:hypothetical protein